MRSAVAISALLALVPVACASHVSPTPIRVATPPPTASRAPSPTASPAPSPLATPTPSPDATPISFQYVALGDSYTIGTSVSEHERWPNQLVERLRRTIALDLVANLGVNGYTSQDLIEYELPQLGRFKPDFVTVLIGVNDVVQGVTESVYSAHVDHILDTLIAAVGEGRIVVVSVPDYTLTPQGSAFGDPAQQRAEIRRLNEVMAAHCADRGIQFVSIDDAANRVPTDRALVARDGLHPSGSQYTLWVDLIAPTVLEALS